MSHRAKAQQTKSSAACPNLRAPSRRPLYAIGDIRGDVERLLKLLVAHGIIEMRDQTFEWIKRDVIVLLMGNVLDAKSAMGAFGDMLFDDSTSDLWILQFLQEASVKAGRAKSAILSVLGEREVRNALGDYSETSPYHCTDRNERRRHLAPGGAGFASLCSSFVTSLTHGDVVYSHAGIPLNASVVQRRIVNKRVGPPVLAAQNVCEVLGFVGHRDYARAPSRNDQEKLETALRRRRARRYVVGHYHTGNKGIVAGWGGRVVYTDVGISRAITPHATKHSSSVLYDSGQEGEDLQVLHLDGTTEPVPSGDL